MEFLDVWNEAYAAIMDHERSRDGYWVRRHILACLYSNVNQFRIVSMSLGTLGSTNVDALTAFWPGLQVLAGDIQGAIKSHLFCKYLACT